MKSFDYCSGTHFIFGKDRENEVGSYAKKYGANRILIIYGGQSVIRSGLLDRVCSSLSDEGIYYTQLSGVKPNPRSGLVYQGIEICRRENIDFLLAIGGGSVIDTAKAIALGSVYDGDFWDFFSGKTPEKAMPLGAVVTVSASGSEGSISAIITNEKTLDKTSVNSNLIRPTFSILNPALTESLPPFQTACGVTDIMSHAFERYFSNTSDVETSDRLLEAILCSMIHEGKRVMADPHDFGARANIMWAGMLVQNDILGADRQPDWNSHHLEHVLSALYDCPHGAGLSVIMPAWMEYCVEHHDCMRFAQMACRVFGCQMDFVSPINTAKAGITAFKDFLRSIGMPLTFAEIGADPEDIDKMVAMNHIGDGVTGGYVGLDAAAIKEIYMIAAGTH